MNWRLGLSRIWIVYAVFCVGFVSILNYQTFGEYLATWVVLTLPVLGLFFGIIWVKEGFSSDA